MDWRERDLLCSVPTVLIFMLLIYESTGSSPKVMLSHSESYAPSNSPSYPLKGKTTHDSGPDQASSPIDTDDNINGNIGLSPYLLPPQSQHSGSPSKIAFLHNESDNNFAPSNSPLHSSEERTTHMSKNAISPIEHKGDGMGGNTGSSSFSPFLTPSQHSASSLPPVPFQAPLHPNLSPMQQSKKRENYASHPDVQEPIMPPLHPPSPLTRKNGRHFAPPPYNDIQAVYSPSQTPLSNLDNKRRHHVPPPIFDGFQMTPSVSHSKRKGPYADYSDINSAPLSSPVETKRSNKWHYALPIYPQGLDLPPIPAPLPSSTGEISSAPLPIPSSPPNYIIWQIYSPEPSPTTSGGKSRSPSPPSKRVLPPPPPNMECGSMMCQPPLTNPSPGSPCACVLPIKIGLCLVVDLYTFFPLVSEFAKEIAAGTYMKQSQVRIMGANSASEDPEKTDVLINLVPLGKSFDNETVFRTFEKFWQKQVSIQESYFGDYIVLYVSYPGLPPSPPQATYVDGEAYHSGSNGRMIHPLGVDVRKQREKHSGSLIAIVAMSSVLALFLIIGAAWLLLILRRRKLSSFFASNVQSSQHPHGKSSVAAGAVPVNVGTGTASNSASYSSKVATYSGSIKSFTVAEMERTTSMFDDSRIIGEGGFGRVYRGTLDDGAVVAVKVLKRDDPQGEREFLAEVDMLTRLHHRNLVKLIGTCAEKNIRCLVYELVPNGSVESHLHDEGNGTSKLDWNSRVKIALGTARALAYLHEDSSPCVIHRDFKSSNILLEHDFTPKVSDFGLARSVPEEGEEPISTRVMGTFGYVDPEYAMTGHLLVKSDVYSYGVVLLELLTGRKPVDMSQPPGQENLVAWTRSLLTSMEGLETIIDPALGPNYPRDSVAKVAAIASMCVQAEVSNRPLMSEVVQALKFLSDESDDCRQSERSSQEELSMRDVEAGVSEGPRRKRLELDGICASSRFMGEVSCSFRRSYSSGSSRNGTRRLLWQKVRGIVSGSSSEHGFQHRFWS